MRSSTFPTVRAVCFLSCVGATVPCSPDVKVILAFRAALGYAHLVDWSFGPSSVCLVEGAERCATGAALGW